MQSEPTTPPPGGGLLAIAVTATGAPSTPLVAATRDGDRDADGRWRVWRDRGARNDKDRARAINLVFVVIVIALSAWLVFQLIS